MNYALLAACVLIIIAGCIGVRIASVAIVNAGGIAGGLIAIATVFAVGYGVRNYLD